MLAPIEAQPCRSHKQVELSDDVVQGDVCWGSRLD